MVTVVVDLKKTKNIIVFCMIFLVILNIVSAECSDTDSGKDYYQKGHFVGTNVWEDEIDVEDSCMNDGTTLTENYCEEDYFKRETYDCSSAGLICFLGKCTEATDTDFCEDDEVGKSSDVQGSITFSENNEEKHARDDCSVSANLPNMLYEWYCDGVNAKVDEINCDGFCYEGTCQSCIDSDSGKNYDEKGSTKGSSGTIKEDECKTNILTEWYCSDSGLMQQETVNCENFGEICSDGRCVGNPCIDNEPQKDIAVRGTVHYHDQVGDDYCDENILQEIYCSGSEVFYDEIDCEEMGLKCVAGKCLDEDDITCEDSDPDNDISQLGIITIAGETQEDFCSGETLFQLDCKKNEITTDTYICSKEGKYCLNGVCKNCPQGTTYGGGDVVFQIMMVMEFQI